MLFNYTALDKNGRKITATDEASDEASLVARLQSRGMVVVNVLPVESGSREVFTAGFKRQAKFTHKRVRLSDLVIFSRQLATMLGSGVNLLKSIEVILQQADSSRMFDCLSQVKRDMEQGLPLSSALSKHPKIFNQFWVSLTEVGEASGTLPVILERLAFYLEQKAAFQNKVFSAILYPAVLLLVCTFALIFFALKIIPTFTEIFKNFGIKLPPLTQAVVSFFTFIQTKFFILILVIGGIIYLAALYFKTEQGRKKLETFLFKLPIAGYFYSVFLIERFTSQMSILAESGVPILYALEICQRMIGNKTMEDVIGFVKNNVREGKLIAEPMQRSGFFTPMVVQMVLVGEETGELSKMLKKVASYYQDYVTTFIARFSSLFEPLMIIVMGIVIGLIVIAMYLPIFNIATIRGGG